MKTTNDDENKSHEGASRAMGLVAAALAKAQAAFSPISKNKTAVVEYKDRNERSGSYKYQYADLADVLESIRKPLAENELALTHELTGTILMTRLIHSSGQYLETAYPLPDPSRMSAQNFGSALTYARRYSVCALVGVVAETDDDGAAGNDAMRNQTSSRPQSAQTAKVPQAVAQKEAVTVSVNKWGAQEATKHPMEFAAFCRNSIPDFKSALDVEAFEKEHITALMALTKANGSVAAALKRDLDHIKASFAMNGADGDDIPF